MTHKALETAFIQIIPQDDPKQALRLRRFFMALAVYILAWSFACFCYLANIMDWESIYPCLIGIPLINIILYIVFRTGLNLRMSDPSLTSIQMCIAMLVVMYGIYYANEVRGFLLLCYIPILLFGIFRLYTRQFILISIFALLTYGIDIVLLHVFNPQRVNFKIEYFQWCVLSIVLVIISFMGGHISSIRRNLSTSRAELKAEIGEKEKAQESMAHSIASLQTINTIADKIYRVIDYPSLAREAIAAMIEYGKTATVTMFEYNEDEKCLIMTDASEPAEKAYSRVLTQRLYLDKSAAGDAVREKKIILCEDIATDSRILPATKEALLNEGRISAVFIPLLFQDRVMGTIHLVFTERLSLKDYELETLLSIGKNIGMAMANVRYIQQIKAEIQERKEAEEALRKSEELTTKLIQTVPDIIVRTNLNGDILFINDIGLRESGYQDTELIGQSIFSFIAPEDQDKAVRNTTLMLEGVIGPHDYNLIMKGDRKLLVEINGDVLRNKDGSPSGLVLICRDITERKKSEEKIKQMAYHDSLTGLPNRKLFSDRLGIALARAQRNQKKLGIAMLDLDKFKGVNDTLGHDAGDILLKITAERLSAALRKGDTVARFGGDEFLLILSDLEVIEDAIQVAQKIVESFNQPFLIDTHQLVVTTSIGIAVYPDNGTDEGMLLKNADIAMYLAKQAGRNQYSFSKNV